MSTETTNKTRYSDSELAEFKAVIDAKIAKAKEQMNDLQEQMLEMTENNSDEHGGDWIDDSSYNTTMEMLNTMSIRQRKHIQDLENALIRIKNKTYGVCVLSGELIDKKRLMAVPTTAKSLLAKNREQEEIIEKSKPKPVLASPIKSDGPKVISRIIRKSAPSPVKPVSEPQFEDDYEEDFDEELIEEKDNIDLDELPDESSSSDDFEI